MDLARRSDLLHDRAQLGSDAEGAIWVPFSGLVRSLLGGTSPIQHLKTLWHKMRHAEHIPPYIFNFTLHYVRVCSFLSGETIDVNYSNFRSPQSASDLDRECMQFLPVVSGIQQGPPDEGRYYIWRENCRSRPKLNVSPQVQLYCATLDLYVAGLCKKEFRLNLPSTLELLKKLTSEPNENFFVLLFPSFLLGLVCKTKSDRDSITTAILSIKEHTQLISPVIVL